MNKNAFTLIELLAVIVILAIIALIATPIILDIINDTKVQANKRSAEMYLKSVDNEIASLAINNETITDGSYKIENGNICLDDGCNKKIEVKITGEVPKEGTIVFQKGKVIQGTILKYKNNASFIINEKGELVLGEIKEIKTYKDGDIVYFDITTGKSCTNYHEDNSKTGYNGLEATKTTDNQNSCLKFYAFLDDGAEKLNLLLDHNTTAKLAWNTSGNNASGPAEVINQLKTDTNEWVGTITPTNYEYKGTVRPYTIDYSEYKARLITANEIAKITGADQLLSWNETSTTSGWYYLDGAKTNDTVPNWQTQVANSTNKSDFYWLFDRTNSCTSYGCINSDSSTYGYWTSSAHAIYSGSAWNVDNDGYLLYNNVSNAGYYGVRPVITILKSNI